MNFYFIFSYKILKSQIFFLIFQVDPSQTVQPGTRPLFRVKPQVRFENYGCHENITLKNTIEKK
jgi:hypothetical protein